MKSDDSSTVYFDTSAWNAIYDWAANNNRKWFEGAGYLFSSCNLDEFALALTARAKDLATFAWQISNREKLLDHLELTTAEIAAYQTGTEIDYVDHHDRGFALAWRAMRIGDIPAKMHADLTTKMQDAKTQYRAYLRLGRELFHPIFSAAAGAGFKRKWPELLRELEGGQEMRNMLKSALTESDLLRNLPNPFALDEVPFDAIPCTTCWMQYHIAMHYLASFNSQHLGSPEIGEQIDYRHACYAGMCDVFVTGDARMHEILRTMIPSCRARLLTPQEYINELGTRSL